MQKQFQKTNWQIDGPNIHIFIMCAREISKAEIYEKKHLKKSPMKLAEFFGSSEFISLTRFLKAPWTCLLEIHCFVHILRLAALERLQRQRISKWKSKISSSSDKQLSLLFSMFDFFIVIAFTSFLLHDLIAFVQRTLGAFVMRDREYQTCLIIGNYTNDRIS